MTVVNLRKPNGQQEPAPNCVLDNQWSTQEGLKQGAAVGLGETERDGVGFPGDSLLGTDSPSHVHFAGVVPAGPSWPQASLARDEGKQQSQRKAEKAHLSSTCPRLILRPTLFPFLIMSTMGHTAGWPAASSAQKGVPTSAIQAQYHHHK